MWIISPKLGTLGYLALRTRNGKSDNSENQAGFHPNGDHATLAAEIPEQTHPNLMLTLPPFGNLCCQFVSEACISLVKVH